MQILNQILQFLRQAIVALFNVIQTIWQWSVKQILAVTAALVAYLLYRAAKELLDAGEKALSAFVTLLTVFVRTLPPILLAGAAAAGGAWIVNHINL